MLDEGFMAEASVSGTNTIQDGTHCKSSWKAKPKSSSNDTCSRLPLHQGS